MRYIVAYKKTGWIQIKHNCPIYSQFMIQVVLDAILYSRGVELYTSEQHPVHSRGHSVMLGTFLGYHPVALKWWQHLTPSPPAMVAVVLVAFANVCASVAWVCPLPLLPPALSTCYQYHLHCLGLPTTSPLLLSPLPLPLGPSWCHQGLLASCLGKGEKKWAPGQLTSKVMNRSGPANVCVFWEWRLISDQFTAHPTFHLDLTNFST